MAPTLEKSIAAELARERQPYLRTLELNWPLSAERRRGAA